MQTTKLFETVYMHYRNSIVSLHLLVLFMFMGAQLSAQNQSLLPSVDQLIKQAQTAKQDTNCVNLFDLIAEFYLNTDRQKALVYANRELELSKQLDWVMGQVKAFYLLSKAYYTSNENQKGMDALEQGYSLAQKYHLLSWQYKIQMRRGLEYMSLKKYEQAIQDFKGAVGYFRQTNDLETRGLAPVPTWEEPAVFIGRLYSTQNKESEAFNFYQQILDQYKKEKDSLGIRTALNLFFQYTMGGVHHDYNKALEYAFEELRYFRQSDTTNVRSSVLIDIANAYESQKNYVKALEYYRSANVLKPKGDLQVRNSANAGMRQIYSMLGDYGNALKFDLERLETNSGLYTGSNSFSLVFLYKDLADDYTQLMQYDQALQYLNKGVQYSITLGEPSLTAGFIGSVAHIYYLTQQYNKAFNAVKKGLNVKKQNEYTLSLSSGYMGMIIRDAPNKVLARYGIQPSLRYKLAIKNLQLAVNSTKQINDPAILQDWYRELSTTYESMKDYRQFHDTYKQYIALRDSSVNRQNQNAFISKLADIQFEKKEDSLKYQQRITDEKLTRQTQQTAQQRKYYLSGIAALLALSFFIARNYYNQRRSNKLISAEKQRSDDLLLNILPADVAEELKEKGTADARLFEEVTVLFTDFVNFTAVGELLTPQELVDELHACFKAFDEIISRHNIEKIKTIGDAYLAVAGLPHADAQHAYNTVKAALEIRQFIHDRKELKGSRSFDIRIGIHSGSVVAGIVGVKKFAYDIWGDTVNTAARMEQNSLPGRINLSEKTYELVKDQFAFTYRGEIEAKNKGALKMYFVEMQREAVYG